MTGLPVSESLDGYVRIGDEDPLVYPQILEKYPELDRLIHAFNQMYGQSHRVPSEAKL